MLKKQGLDMSKIVDVYMDKLCGLAKQNEKIILIDCDLAKVFQSNIFKERFPNRYLNVGIAEQNAMGVAAGLAAKGYFPIVQSYACFLANKCCDQVVNSLAVNELPVLIIGGKAGVSDGQGGVSHHSINDYGIIASIPQTSFFSPITSDQLRYTFDSFLNAKKSCFMRLYDNEIFTYDQHGGGKWFLLYPEGELLLITTGDQFYNCLKVREKLLLEKIQASIVYVNQMKPLPLELIEVCCKYKYCFMIETHNYMNSFGMMLNYRLNKRKPTNFTIIAINDCYSESGSYYDICKYLKIDIDAIINEIKEELSNQTTMMIL